LNRLDAFLLILYLFAIGGHVFAQRHYAKSSWLYTLTFGWLGAQKVKKSEFSTNLHLEVEGAEFDDLAASRFAAERNRTMEPIHAPGVKTLFSTDLATPNFVGVTHSKLVSTKTPRKSTYAATRAVSRHRAGRTAPAE
jgi:hypothetical protein